MTTLTDPREVAAGTKVSFMYKNKERVGHVVGVDKRFFTIEHEKPEEYDGKRYSSYSFLKLGSRIDVI